MPYPKSYPPPRTQLRHAIHLGVGLVSHLLFVELFYGRLYCTGVRGSSAHNLLFCVLGDSAHWKCRGGNDTVVGLLEKETLFDGTDVEEGGSGSGSALC